MEPCARLYPTFLVKKIVPKTMRKIARQKIKGYVTLKRIGGISIYGDSEFTLYIKVNAQ